MISATTGPRTAREGTSGSRFIDAVSGRTAAWPHFCDMSILMIGLAGRGSPGFPQDNVWLAAASVLGGTETIWPGSSSKQGSHWTFQQPQLKSDHIIKLNVKLTPEFLTNQRYLNWSWSIVLLITASEPSTVIKECWLGPSKILLADLTVENSSKRSHKNKYLILGGQSILLKLKTCNLLGKYARTSTKIFWQFLHLCDAILNQFALFSLLFWLYRVDQGKLL